MIIYKKETLEKSSDNAGEKILVTKWRFLGILFFLSRESYTDPTTLFAREKRQTEDSYRTFIAFKKDIQRGQQAVLKGNGYVVISEKKYNSFCDFEKKHKGVGVCSGRGVVFKEPINGETGSVEATQEP